MLFREEKESLKTKTVKGILWGGVSNGVQQLVGLVFGIYLSRVLDADDYGIVGLLTIFMLVASSIQESGLISAIANKKEVEHKDYNAVFWFGFLVSIGLYLLLYLMAPLISRFFDIPELVTLSRVLFLTFVCGSLGIAHNAYLFRNLRVRERSLSTTLSVLISGVIGVVLAYFGFSYWSMVAQSIAYSFCFSVCCFLFSDFRPSWNIDFGPIKGMWQFSGKILVTNIVNHINNSLLTLYLGKISSKATVGYYSQAHKWSTMTQGVIANMSHGFAQPMLSTLERDHERQTRVFLKLLNFVCFATFPALTALCLVSEEFILITITSKWLPSVALLRILCINAAFLPIINLYSNYLLSQGASALYMRYIITFGIIQFAIIFLCHPFGIVYMVWGISIFTMLWSFVWQISVSKRIKVGFYTLSAIVLKYLATAVPIGVFSFYLGEYFDHIVLSASVKLIAFVALYLFVLYITKSVALHEIIVFIKEKFNGIHRK